MLSTFSALFKLTNCSSVFLNISYFSFLISIYLYSFTCNCFKLLSTYLFIYLFIYISIYLSIYIYIYIYPSIYLSIAPSIYLSIAQSIYISIYPSIFWSALLGRKCLFIGLALKYTLACGSQGNIIFSIHVHCTYVEVDIWVNKSIYLFTFYIDI